MQYYHFCLLICEKNPCQLHFILLFFYLYIYIYIYISIDIYTKKLFRCVAFVVSCIVTTLAVDSRSMLSEALCLF